MAPTPRVAVVTAAVNGADVTAIAVDVSGAVVTAIVADANAATVTAATETVVTETVATKMVLDEADAPAKRSLSPTVDQSPVATVATRRSLVVEPSVSDAHERRVTRINSWS